MARTSCPTGQLATSPAMPAQCLGLKAEVRPASATGRLRGHRRLALFRPQDRTSWRSTLRRHRTDTGCFDENSSRQLTHPSSKARLEVEADERTGVVERGEWILPVHDAALVLLPSLPISLRWTAPTADKQFMGIVLNIPTTCVIFSPGSASSATQNLSANKSSRLETNQPVFSTCLQWSMGRLGVLRRQLRRDVPALRWISTILFGVLVHRMLSWFLCRKLRRQTAFLLVLLGSGLAGCSFSGRSIP